MLQFGGTYTEMAMDIDDEKERIKAAAEAQQMAELTRQPDNAEEELTTGRVATIPASDYWPRSFVDRVEFACMINQIPPPASLYIHSLSDWTSDDFLSTAGYPADRKGCSS